MNEQRRKEIAKIQDQLAACRCDLENLRDEEQEYFDNMPENMQSGDKGQQAESAITELDDAVNSIESAENSLDAAIG